MYNAQLPFWKPNIEEFKHAFFLIGLGIRYEFIDLTLVPNCKI